MTSPNEPDAVLQRQLRYKWAPFTRVRFLERHGVVAVVRGRGSRVYDVQGREYIDAHGGLWLVNVGYGREEIARAVYQQMRELAWFSSFEGYTNLPSIELAERLVGLLAPEGMARIFFTGSGSESVETALKIARQYWRLKGQPGRYKILSRRRAYHGVTFGAMSASGVTANRTMFEPLVPGFRHGPAPYCYRCPLGLSPERCGLACADEMARIIEFEGPETVAAVIAEPVQGAGGVIVPPEGYLARLQEVCRRYQVLFILDEVITGFGRTGEWFGARRWGLRPDIMTFAKGLTSGYVPLGAVAVSEEVYDVFYRSEERAGPFRHGNTYSGHPAACAAALANLRILEEERLVENARRVGERLLAGLRTLARHPMVGHVDGVGLLARVELVQDRESRQPFPPGMGVGDRVALRAREMGVILRPLGDVLSFSPPLCLTEEEADRIVAVVDQAVQDISREIGFGAAATASAGSG